MTKSVIHVETVGGNFFDAANFINRNGIADHILQMEVVGNYTQLIMRMPEAVADKLADSGVIRYRKKADAIHYGRSSK